MKAKSDGQKIVQFVNKIGYDMDRSTVQNIEVQHQKIFDYLPDLAVLVVSFVVKKNFIYQTTAPKSVEDGFCFLFANMFADEKKTNGKRKPKSQEEMAYVQVYPYALSHKTTFKKRSHIKAVSVMVSAEFLKSFLKQDAEQFQFLFDKNKDFVIEEIMTDDILRTVNELVKKEPLSTLNSYYYKLKAMELLFYLFQSLGKRETSVHQKLSGNDIKSIYKVRDTLVSSLQKPSTIEKLKKIAGMNELKMRKLFIQVFGMGIYDYFQHLRMKEAARLLRDDQLSVSEVGYQMGFENLSHFTRVFEKHIGKKPKKYSRELI